VDCRQEHVHGEGEVIERGRHADVPVVRACSTTTTTSKSHSTQHNERLPAYEMPRPVSTTTNVRDSLSEGISRDAAHATGRRGCCSAPAHLRLCANADATNRPFWPLNSELQTEPPGLEVKHVLRGQGNLHFGRRHVEGPQDLEIDNAGIRELDRVRDLARKQSPA
jgi:hypothetical protein